MQIRIEKKPCVCFRVHNGSGLKQELIFELLSFIERTKLQFIFWCCVSWVQSVKSVLLLAGKHWGFSSILIRDSLGDYQLWGLFKAL